MRKENLRKITKEVAASRKRKEIQEKRKGKHKLILSELEDEEKILVTIIDIIEDVIANKVSVETQFKRFVNAGAKQGTPKKVKIATTSVDENIVDLVSTPPPPSPTQITQEDSPPIATISPIDICKNAMPETLKEQFNQNDDFQEYIETLHELLTSVQKITTKFPLIEASAPRHILSQQIG